MKTQNVDNRGGPDWFALAYVYDLDIDSIYVYESDSSAKTPNQKATSSNMSSLIWSDSAVARFITETFGEINFHGYDHPTFTDYAMVDTTALAPGSFYIIAEKLGSFSTADTIGSIWVWSPDRSMAAAVSRPGYDPDSDLRLFNWHDGRLIESLGQCGTPCSYRAVRWLDNQRFIALRLDEVYKGGEGENRWDLAGHAAVVLFYDLENGMLRT